ncbi:MAG: VOC family protein [Actinomycetota bacterium]|nr:VOC family protein [Actinomycetota bacterium]
MSYKVSNERPEMRSEATEQQVPHLPDYASTLIGAIGRVDLRVRDIERSLGFYSSVAGLQIMQRDESGVSLGAGTDVFLHLSSEGVDAPALRRSTGLFHTAIRYPSAADLGDALVRLAETGIPVGAGDHGVSEALYVDDPDGNGVELYRDRPLDEWPTPPSGQKVIGMTGPVDLDRLIELSRGTDALGQPAPLTTDIGHIHLKVSDMARTFEFYSKILGLDVMGEMRDQAGFFSSYGYHHNIGTNTWESRGAGPAPSNHAGLSRVVFEVDGQEEISALAERLSGAEGYHESIESGITVKDPDGIELVFVVAR